MDQKTLDELDELEDEEEERILQEYRYALFNSIMSSCTSAISRRKRLLEIKEKSARARFGEVMEISAVDYIKEVNQAGADLWVVLYLYKSGYTRQHRLYTTTIHLCHA